MKGMRPADSGATAVLVEENVRKGTPLTALKLPLQRCSSGRKDPK